MRFGLFFRFRGAGNLSGVSVGAIFGFPVRFHCLAVAMACPFHNDFHQTDLRIVDATARRMGRPKEKYMIDIAPFGNATAATVPLCMRACESGLKKGDNPILAAFGGGCMRGSVFVERVCDGGGFSKWRKPGNEPSGVPERFYRATGRNLMPPGMSFFAPVLGGRNRWNPAPGQAR